MAEGEDNESFARPSHLNQAGRSAGPMVKYLGTGIGRDDQTMAATIARMTACDGLPFVVFTTSLYTLEEGHADIGFLTAEVRKFSWTTIVLDQGDRVRAMVISQLHIQKEQGQRFSLTFDEWTSTRNRRCMNINVHDQGAQFWSLGLLRVHGSMPAERCVELFQLKLTSFGLSLAKDTVSICTDGASVMTKVGKLIETEQPVMLCT